LCVIVVLLSCGNATARGDKMNTKLSEKIQNDLIAYFDGMSEELIDEVCLIVAKNCLEEETK